MLRLHSYRYHRPAALADALELLAEHGPAAMVVAGGTDLVPNMKHRLFTPDHLVALKGVRELHGIELDGPGDVATAVSGPAPSAGEICIGAAETLAAVSRH